jgi:hypothetical protein
MTYVLLIIILFIIVPLGITRGDLKRIGLIAVGLEVLKILLILTLVDSPLALKNESAGFLSTILIFIIMLPELLIGHTHDSISIWMKIAMFVGGATWNLIPAYLISLCLPWKRVASRQEGTHLLNNKS